MTSFDLFAIFVWHSSGKKKKKNGGVRGFGISLMAVVL